MPYAGASLRNVPTLNLRAVKSSGLLMASVIYRCPTKSLKVQAWFDGLPNYEEAYISLRCPACARIHLVNPLTGKTPADE
jgi:hypothetical protein